MIGMTRYEDPRRSQAPPYRETTASEDRESEIRYKALSRSKPINLDGPELVPDMSKIRKWTEEAQRADHDNQCQKDLEVE